MGRGRKARPRAPGLDGVRAIAVLAVIGYHEGAGALSGGFLGVDVFFVLSGFLITDVLRTQRPALAEFWRRRARRLLPALAVMLVVVTAVATAAGVPSQRQALLAAATYTSNWYQMLHHVPYFDGFGPPPPLEHLWSLAIEEQFYLLWPVVVLLTARKHNDSGYLFAVCVSSAVASAVAMGLLYSPANPSLVYYGTHTHASALLIGAALAVVCPLATLTRLKAAMARRLDAAGMAGLVVLAWAMGHFSGGDPAVYPYGLLLAALAAAALIAAAASKGTIAAVASAPPLRWIGQRSYSMYLWHWPVIALAGRAGRSPLAKVAEIAVTVSIAAVSWRFVEEPVLRDGMRATMASWWHTARRPWRRPRPLPIATSVSALAVLVLAGYGVVVPSGPSAETGLLRQIAQGERISAASQRAEPVHPAHLARPARAVPPAKRRPSCGASRPDGRQVTAIGDSVLLASAVALTQTLPGISIDAAIGRQMQDGVRIVRSLAASGRLRRFVVVGLGTNGPITPGEVWHLRLAVGQGRELILVTSYGPMSWTAEVNGVIAEATRHKPRVAIADWAAAIAGHPDLLWDDGIHPRPAGASLYARVITRAIRAAARSLPAACG